MLSMQGYLEKLPVNQSKVKFYFDISCVFMKIYFIKKNSNIYFLAGKTF